MVSFLNMIKTLRIFLPALIIFCFSAQLVFALSWAPVSVSSANAVALDADGSNLIAGTNSAILTSSNGGLSWTSDSGFGISTVASDSDGTNLIVAETFGGIFTSDDSGANWTERSPGGSSADRHWRSVASDADGSNLIAGFYHSGGIAGTLYTSDDSGANWTERQPAGAGVKKWLSVDSDSDGSNLIAGMFESRLYTSSNSGVNWTERQPAGNINGTWVVASDADGSNLIVAARDARLYTSSNGGVNWTERQPAGVSNQAWTSVSSDDDGSHLIAAVSNGRLYVSDDSGVSWDEEIPLGSLNKFWTSVTSDDDGSHFAAASLLDPLYISPDIIEPAISSVDPADGAIEVDLSTTFTIVFDEDIATSTGNIVLYDASDDSVVETIDIAGSQVTLSGTDTLVIDPLVTLELGTGYYFLIDAGTIEDLLGNPFAGISDPTIWNFTADVPPSISGFAPADDETGVALNRASYSITFDQTVVVGTGSITLHNASDDSTVETFDVTDGDAVVIEETAAYLYPTISLDTNTEYYFQIDSGVVEDESGNIFSGISDSTTWNFTTAPATTFDFERISVSDEAEEGDGTSQNSKISNDGRYVVFESIAANLVTGDTNGTYDTFVYDRNLNTIERVSLNSEGEENVENVQASGISGDGRFVTFTTSGLLFPENIVGVNNIFVYDRDMQELEFVSKNEGGEEGDGDSIRSSISDDGRYVVFESDATNLVPGDINNRADIFVYDRDTDTITREVLFDDGDPYYMNGNNGELTVSSDGQHIVYVRFDENTFLTNIFLFDRESDTTEQIDVSSDEVSGDDSASFPAVSEDSRYIVFQSNATNLTADVVGGSGAVFLRDRTLGTTELIGSEYVSGNGYVSADGPVSISSDGRYVFYSASDEGGDNLHLYRYDREENIELLITEGVGVADGGASALYPDVSDDGTVVSFYSSNTNLVIGDTNGVADVFVWEEVADEETPEEEEDNDTGGRSGSSGGHRQSVSPVTVVQGIQDIQEATKIAIMEKIIVLLKQLLEKLLAGQTV